MKRSEKTKSENAQTRAWSRDRTDRCLSPTQQRTNGVVQNVYLESGTTESKTALSLTSCVTLDKFLNLIPDIFI